MENLATKVLEIEEAWGPIEHTTLGTIVPVPYAKWLRLVELADEIVSE